MIINIGSPVYYFPIIKSFIGFVHLLPVSFSPILELLPLSTLC